MTTATLFPIVADTVADTLRGLGRLDPAARTPCQEWDAATLINHFTGTTAALGRIGRAEPLDPDNPWAQGQRVADGEWSGPLADGVAGLGTAWARDEAWQGTISFGESEMTAEAVGQMAFAEALLHGWDLSRTAGHSLDIPDEVGAELLRLVSLSADLGRSMGAYGPEIKLSGDRPAFDRALALAGRDPDWAGPDRRA